MNFLITNPTKIDYVDKVFDRLQDNLTLKAHLNDSENKRFLIMQIEQNEVYINWLLRENKGAKEEIENVFKTIEKIDELQIGIAKGKEKTYAVVDKLYNEAYGNIPSIANHLFDFAKPLYTSRVEKIFNKITSKNFENSFEQNL